MFKKFITHVANGNFKYLVDRISNILLPRPNPIFFWDRFILKGGTIIKQDLTRLRLNTAYSVDYITEADLDEIDKLDPSLGTNHRKYYYTENCVGLKVVYKEEIVAFTWVYFNNTYETNCGLILTPPNKRAWVYYVFVAPAHRLSGVFVVLTTYLGQEIEKRGYEGQIAETNVGNTVAIKANNKIGIKVTHNVFLISVFGLKVYFLCNVSDNSLTINYRWTYDVYPVRYIRP